MAYERNFKIWSYLRPAEPHVPHVEMWLNNTFATTALDTPVEFMFASRKLDLSEK